MKKVSDLIKLNILIIFGALLLLYYMNWLSNQGAGLAVGIIAVICSAYYLGVGIASILAGAKISASVKKILDVVSVSLFAVFMFVFFLLSTIQGAKIQNYMGPTAWIIAILSMIAALALPTVYVASRFNNKPILTRLAYLFAAIFALVLLLNILFDGRGNSIILGNVDILLAAIYLAYLFFLFNSFAKPDSEPEPEPKPEEGEPAEAPSEQAEETADASFLVGADSPEEKQE